MILLDTNAILWVQVGHRRVARLLRAERLYASPVSRLELALLVEIGKLRLKDGAGVAQLMGDDRWTVDEPSAGDWFERSGDLSWTRDPFDRLLAAHALLRDWRLATADERLLDNLPEKNCFEL